MLAIPLQLATSANLVEQPRGWRERLRAVLHRGNFPEGNYPFTVGTKNPYVDYRLGGVPQYYLTPRKDIDMRLPDEVLKSVVFIGKKVRDKIHYGGTGFLLWLREVEDGRTFKFGYLVTANHVAEQLSSDVFYVRVNLKKEQTSMDIPLNWEPGNEVIWYRHSTGNHADVAITPVHPQPEFDVLMLPVEETLLSDEKRTTLGIGVGDEVFMVGLFSYVKGKSQSTPIVRVGNIAMFPNERVQVKTPKNQTLEVDGFLVEARSIGAGSGSPVFARQTIYILNSFHKWGTNIFEPVCGTAFSLNLIGLVCAHWQITPSEIIDVEPTQNVNVGIAVVIPAQKILDILYGPELKDMRRKVIEAEKAKDHKSAATMDSGFVEAPFTQQDFEQALKKASRKIEPGPKPKRSS
jgi:hypothetical protein